VQLLLEKMRNGAVVPSLTPEERMDLLYTVMSNRALHKHASEGYKKTGQSIDLHGTEDGLVCREAGAFWNEPTTCGLPDMRAKLDPVLIAVAEEHEAGRLTWSQRDVQRLISPYPANKKADHVLAALGDDFYHDDIHALENGDDATAIADADQEASASSAEEDDEPVAPVDAIELHGDAETAVADEDMDIPMLSAEQADEVHKVRSTMATLEATIESLLGTGQLRVVQVVQQQLAKENKKKRNICQESPAVAESFSRLRKAEHQDILRQQQLAQRSRALQRDAQRAVQTKDDALAHLRETKRKIQDAESVSAARHCLKTFTLEQLGDSSPVAGGGNGKQIATTCLTAWLVYVSLKVRGMTSNGSRMPGTRKWSHCMDPSGQSCLCPGCKAS